MMLYLRRVLEHKRDEGATAVEYGLLVAAIAAVIVVVVFALGGYVKGAFSKTCDNIASSGQAQTRGSDCPGSGSGGGTGN
jgi:pilus assembly protein Flp/PilA